ncbi:uncharacterized protein LOC111265453 isoform X2 [Varroa jacobsoni]|uniref:uncharacterized protein LOC111265453 isoform X2 n=1 Tax=Varroa jacobsoni TaxID=62625 RepID=UPI000BF9115F|nr:uncharacterized protein LOC111265453 isoform X2 [Varroa jacobsoni]
MILEGILLTISGLLIHIRAQSEYDKVSIKAEFIVKSFTLHDARPGVFVLWPQAKKNMVISDGAGTNFRVKFKVGLSPECDTNTIIGRKIECSLEPFRLLTADEVEVRECLRPISLRWKALLLIIFCLILVFISGLILCRVLCDKSSCFRVISPTKVHDLRGGHAPETDEKPVTRKAPLVSSDISNTSGVLQSCKGLRTFEQVKHKPIGPVYGRFEDNLVFATC